MNIPACDHATPRETDALYEVDGEWLCVQCLAAVVRDLDREIRVAVHELQRLKDRREYLYGLPGYSPSGAPYIDGWLTYRVPISSDEGEGAA